MSTIPIQNIWLLMLYASDFYQYMGQQRWGSEALDTDMPQALLQYFAEQVQLYLHALQPAYQHHTQRLTQVRGRIDVSTTYRHQLLERGQVQCHVHQLHVNTLRHQYLMHAIEQLKTKASLTIQQMLYRSWLELLQQGIQPLTVKYYPQRDQFAQHERQQQQLLLMADLLLKMHFPQQIQGLNHHLQAPEYGPWLRLLFEKAMAGFYQRHLTPTWKTFKGVCLQWSPSAMQSNLYDYIPQMKTDFILQHRQHEQCILVDTKFTNIVHQGYYRPKELFKSQYLYQMYSYLRSQEYEHSPWKFTDAMLLHPSLGQHFQDHVMIQQYKIYYCTVDLSQARRVIEQQLKSFITHISQAVAATT